MGVYSETYFEPDCSVGYLARRIYQIGLTGLEPVFATEGLTNMQWHALISIRFGRGTTPAELARDLSHDKGATTRLLDTLEARGLLARTRGADDRRLVKLSLTPLGEEVAHRVRGKLIATWNEWLADWPRDELDGAVATMQRLRDTLLEKVQ